MFDTPASGSGGPAENQATPITQAAPAAPAIPVAVPAIPAIPVNPLAPVAPAVPVAGPVVEPELAAARPYPPATSDSPTSSSLSASSGASESSPVADFAALLAELRLDIPDPELLDRIRELEDVKAAAAAAQARATAAFDASQRAAQTRAGVAKAKLGEGIASQIALARRDSPARGSRHLGLAHALVEEMPHTLAALTTATLNEWRATLLVRETACLDAGDRARVDAALAADPTRLEGLGDKRLIAAAKKEAYRLDPHTVVRRAAKAVTERTVTTRPAPDTMTYVTALLPVAHGIAVQAALEKAATRLRAAGDERGRGQLMADTLVDRITRPTDQQDGKPDVAGGAGIEIQLVMTDRTLLAGDHEPAHLTGYGTIPAGYARDLILGPRTTGHTPRPSSNAPGQHTATAGKGYRQQEPGSGKTDGLYAGQGAGMLDRLMAGHSKRDQDHGGQDSEDEAKVWIRRLYTAPGTGQLIAMDSTARIFPKGLRRMIITRDQTCRTPWCDAPIRQIDHILAHGIGGQTTENNGGGLCERCNHAKTATGYHATPIPAPSSRHTMEITTPTGHLYHSTAPPLPGTAVPPPPETSGPSRPQTEPAPSSDTAHPPPAPRLPRNARGDLHKRNATTPRKRPANVPPPPARPPRIGRDRPDNRRAG